MKRMKDVGSMVDMESLKMLATPSSMRLGSEIAKYGDVDLVELDPMKVTAKVKPINGEMRTVILTSKNDNLWWQCTCTSDPKHFCKHCVAASIICYKLVNQGIYSKEI